MRTYWITSPRARFIALLDYNKGDYAFRIWRVEDLRGGLAVVERGAFPVENLFGEPYAVGGGRATYDVVMDMITARLAELDD